MPTASPKPADWKLVGPVVETPPQRTLHALFTPVQTAEAIYRERCRADRAGSTFSLVMFRLPRNIGHSRSTMRLARTVLSRSRGTDAVGWFDEQTVCALLPDTAAAGAEHFVENVTDSTREVSQRPEAVVYTYPTSWFLNEGVAARAKTTAPAPGSAAQAKPVRSVEELLVRRMPWWKRTIDFVGATFALVLFSPLFLLIAAAIRFTSPGPAIFAQNRSGLGGRPFRIYKFRTMCKDAEARKSALRTHSEQDGPAFKMVNDPRITRVGKLLRKTSLDELPQLWNVLRGEMSLVGPRPLPLDEQNGVERWQRARLEVTPGLTCIWQVKGRSQVSFADWVRMDLSYLRRRSLTGDLKILFATIPAVLLRRGAR